MEKQATEKNLTASGAPLKAPKTSYVTVPQQNYKDHLEFLKEDFFIGFNRPDKIVTDKSKFEFFGPIVAGRFNTMVLVRHKETDDTSVAKKINKSSIMKNKLLQQVFLQKEVLLSIKFPFIITLEYTTKDFCNIFFVYPLGTAGDLSIYLRKINYLKEKDAIFYGAQMLLAIEYLHQLGLVFRNLRPENILIQPNGYIKVTNFRFCKFMVQHRTYTLCGSPEYLPPEMIQIKGYGMSVDWWIFGIILYEMIAGYTPFYSADPIQCAENILEGKLKFNENFSTKVRHLLKNILQVDLSKRYGNLKHGLTDIKFHDWFQVIDWQAIYNRKIIPPYKPSPIYDVDELEQTEDKYQEITDCEDYEKEFEFF